MAGVILIIDDEEPVRDAFFLALEPAGYEVRTAACGREGVTMATEVRPELIFLDLRMPELDGVQTLKLLQPCCKEVPIFIVTAFRRDFLEDLEQAARDGIAFQVVDKPLTPDQIRTIVRSTLSGPEVV